MPRARPPSPSSRLPLAIGAGLLALTGLGAWLSAPPPPPEVWDGWVLEVEGLH